MAFPGAPVLCKSCRRPLPQGADGAYCAAPHCQTKSKLDASSAAASQMGALQADLHDRTLKRVDRALAVAKERMLAAGDAARSGPVVTELAPYFKQELAEPDEDRRAALVAHIDQILDAAFVYGPVDPGSCAPWELETDMDVQDRQRLVDDEPMTLTGACIACQGDCCRQAYHTNAFLTVRTVMSVLASAPDTTQADLRQAYLDRLPDKSVPKSCQFHGAMGCTLPRDLRATVCSRYECGARKRLRAELDRTGAHRVVVASLTEDHHKHPEAGADVLRVVSVDGDAVQVHDDLRPDALPAKPPTLPKGPQAAIGHAAATGPGRRL